MAKISRRKLADRAAERIVSGDAKKNVLQELAAYLIDSKRQREAELVTRDIETALIKRGYMVATVTSARKLTAEAANTIEAFIKQQYADVKHIVLRENIDESVIGGVRLELPDKQLDV